MFTAKLSPAFGVGSEQSYVVCGCKASRLQQDQKITPYKPEMLSLASVSIAIAADDFTGVPRLCLQGQANKPRGKWEHQKEARVWEN